VVSVGAPGSGPVSVNVGGFVSSSQSSVYWDGDNQNGQWVQDGTYYVQMTSTDSFGAVRSSSMAIAVLGAPNTASLQVFNSAGELVRTLQLSGVGSLPTDLSTDTRSFSTSVNPVTGQLQGGLGLTLKVGGTGTQQVIWDGLSDQGQPVDSGVYVVKLSYTAAGSTTVVKTLSVTLLQGPNSSAKLAVASAILAPNPFRPSSGQGLVLRFKPCPQGQGAVRVYSLNGELVGQSGDALSSGRITVKTGASEGIYLVDFEIHDGSAVLARRMMKVAVVR
jgi:flagellar hook assembly protein FlgD